MSWFRKIIDKNVEIWHYTCENGHKWKSRKSPCGNVSHTGYNLCGNPCTRCPICKSEICRGEVYINGEITCMGACHVGFAEKK